MRRLYQSMFVLISDVVRTLCSSALISFQTYPTPEMRAAAVRFKTLHQRGNVPFTRTPDRVNFSRYLRDLAAVSLSHDLTRPKDAYSKMGLTEEL